MRGNSARCGRNHCYCCDGCQMDSDPIQCRLCDEEVESEDALEHGLCSDCRATADAKLAVFLSGLTPADLARLDALLERKYMATWLACMLDRPLMDLVEARLRNFLLGLDSNEIGYLDDMMDGITFADWLERRREHAKRTQSGASRSGDRVRAG